MTSFLSGDLYTVGSIGPQDTQPAQKMENSTYLILGGKQGMDV